MLLDNRPKRLDPCTSSVISVSFGQSFWSVMVFCTICGKQIHGGNVWNCQHPDGRAHHKFHHWCRDNAISGLGIVWYVWWCFDMFGGFWCFSFKKKCFFPGLFAFFLINLIDLVDFGCVWCVCLTCLIWLICLICLSFCWNPCMYLSLLILLMLLFLFFVACIFNMLWIFMNFMNFKYFVFFVLKFDKFVEYVFYDFYD